jgi:molecular chaperone DnaK (HSP70)
VTHPNSSVAEITGLLGASSVDLRSHRDFSKLENSSGDPKIGVKLVYQGQKRNFLPEQLVAAVLKHLSKIVAEDAENKVNGQNNYYVLSAPNYFTDVERNALLDAARYLKLDYAKFKVALVIFQLY